MRLYFQDLNEIEQSVFRTTFAFLDGRMAERDAIEWALHLPASSVAERVAILELLDRTDASEMDEPWRSGWRLIEEGWRSFVASQRDEYTLLARVKSGDRSGVLITDFADIVGPRLSVEPFTSMDLAYRKLPKKPKKVSDLFSLSITSGELILPNFLKALSSNDALFLSSLAQALDAKLMSVLSLARRIGWDDGCDWRLGRVYRVEYVASEEDEDTHRDLDAHHSGIAPVVKLLHATVLRLATISIENAKEFVTNWAHVKSSIYFRLWSSLAINSSLVSSADVSRRLLTCNEEEFWNVAAFPEVALARARRYNDFAAADKRAIARRLKKLPPRRFWPRNAEPTRVELERRCAAVLEFRRIEVCGGILDRADKKWLTKSKSNCPTKDDIDVDEGFSRGGRAHFVRPDPDQKYSELMGLERLRALEGGLKAQRISWDNDPAERAGDWIATSNNSKLLLEDLDALADGGSDFPLVWRRLSWALASYDSNGSAGANDGDRTNGVIISLLLRLSDSVLIDAIDGLTAMVDARAENISSSSEGIKLWLRLWPLAVKATNQSPIDRGDEPPDTAEWNSGDGEVADLNTLNTPVGRLVGFFLQSCPSIEPGDEAFKQSSAQLAMRSAIDQALGTSAAIAKYRLVEQMPYFLIADPTWTIEHLVNPLQRQSEAVLWRAVGRQKLSFKVMQYLGNAMSERANDKRLDRDTRRSFVFRIVIDCLDAFRTNRQPAVQHAKIQQMLRSVDDEVRIEGAESIQRYVAGFRSKIEGGGQADAFINAAVPFLENVWPQERALTSPAISRAFADLPATAKDEFVRAVAVIQRYLIPFDCWSMIDFGLFGEEDQVSKLTLIDSADKAEAFLRLLDLTIGTAEGAVTPRDLGDALEQIKLKAPHLATDRRFRRLSTSARR